MYVRVQRDACHAGSSLAPRAGACEPAAMPDYDISTDVRFQPLELIDVAAEAARRDRGST
jgi:hypothetical protein